MKTPTPTSFGDTSLRLDLPRMREIQEKDWQNRDRRIYRSLLEQKATELPITKAPEPATVDRRSFMKWMGGGVALAGLAACTKQPKELIVPYVKAPEEIIPGRPLFFATSYMFGGFGQGVLVESHMGRPTKIEGHAPHPASLGGTDVFAQASVLDLYDPDRSQSSLKNKLPKDFNSFKVELTETLNRLPGGEGVHVVMPNSSSLTEKRLLEKLHAAMPKAKVHVFDPVGCENELAGTQLLFGRPLQVIPRLDQADMILTLDADFLGWGHARARYARDFAKRRSLVDGAERNRLYTIESTFSQTGVNADHRLPVRAARVETLARALATAFGLPGIETELSEKETAFISALVADLKQAGAKGLVLAGEHQSPAVHAIAHAINSQLGAITHTVNFIEPLLNGPVNATEDFQSLVTAMHAGQVKALFLLGVNPVYAAPITLRFADAMARVPFTVHLGQHVDETAQLCLWHLSMTHYLETWADMCAFDGTQSIAQPLIAPLYKSYSLTEILSLLAGEESTAFELVQDTWKARTGLGNDEDAFRRFWRTALHDGIIQDTASRPWLGLRPNLAALESPYTEAVSDFGLEVVFQPDPRVWDGQFANNPWLQELPAPVSTLTWDNAVIMSPNTARRFRIRLTDENVQKRTTVRPTVQIVELNIRNRIVQGPALVIPGHPDDTVTLHLGGGREFGRVAAGVGFNPASLRSVANRWVEQGATVRVLRRRMELALTQDHFPLQADGRAIIREATMAQYHAAPDFARQMGHEFDRRFSLYPEWDYTRGNQWGMVIDLNTCIGCNACMVACQAENNIPTVGKSEVMNSRHMNWIRIDRYFEDMPNGDTRLHVMPMACVHCENAPCETVCPVGATMHSNDGLNMMVYNRCVGTRYCSNNCPYKVRRFNFYKYTDHETESIKLQRNPNVTVRVRGVMEKCTYCVQRISSARIDAKVQNRELRDGDVITACQSACPAGAITFGDINNPDSRVTRLRKHALNHTILESLNTRARTSYLGKVRNPNPVLEPESLQPLTFLHGPGGHHAHDEHGVHLHHQDRPMHH